MGTRMHFSSVIMIRAPEILHFSDHDPCMQRKNRSITIELLPRNGYALGWSSRDPTHVH